MSELAIGDIVEILNDGIDAVGRITRGWPVGTRAKVIGTDSSFWVKVQHEEGYVVWFSTQQVRHMSAVDRLAELA